MPRPKRQHQSRIHVAVATWHATLPPATQEENSLESLLSSTPKKWTVYEPMALLPSGSFTSPPWITVLDSLDQDTTSHLWTYILSEISATGPKVTHLAITEGIPLHNTNSEADNILRSPTGLRMLHGDFGPSNTDNEDFRNAFWVSTKQNGIHQTWAPRWTMFSRGNIKEKARLLKLETPKAKEKEWAVDLYAGIGYFVFSYAALGFNVLCWEINPWSVEGLRRGARANRWSIKVVKGDELDRPTEDIMSEGDQIIVFQESNKRAQERVRGLQESQRKMVHDVRHVNCGFLPTSEPMWKTAWDITALSGAACLHLHENVGVDDIDGRRASIQALFEDYATNEDNRTSEVTHVEQVKTFAPGVWHCVFDVHVTRSNTH